jgi:hypothetical protein
MPKAEGLWGTRLRGVSAATATQPVRPSSEPRSLRRSDLGKRRGQGPVRRLAASAARSRLAGGGPAPASAAPPATCRLSRRHTISTRGCEVAAAWRTAERCCEATGPWQFGRRPAFPGRYPAAVRGAAWCPSPAVRFPRPLSCGRAGARAWCCGSLSRRPLPRPLPAAVRGRRFGVADG